MVINEAPRCYCNTTRNSETDLNILNDTIDY
jgi:hypothetical protein